MSRIPLLSLAGAVALAVSAPAYSKTYYVDSRSGNDAWPGELASPSGSNGPWQSLHRVSIASLLPGDSVLLKCGEKWSETLKLNSSGTAAAPIRIGSYPDTCANKPLIDGARPIPSSGWSNHSGNIYKAKLPSTLISNGALTASTSGWSSWTKNNDASMSIVSACPDSTTACLAFKSGSAGASLLISNSFPIAVSTRYQVTFSIRAPLGSRYGVFTRRSTSPWDTLGLANLTLTGTGAWQTISLPFTAIATASNARLDIQVQQPGATVHLKDVKVAAEGSVPNIVAVTAAGVIQTLAHFPNRGHNKALPDSPYLMTASSSSAIVKADGTNGSEYLVGGADLTAVPQVGQRLVLRNTPWSHSEHTVTKVIEKQIYITPATIAPLEEGGWGYYLTGGLWMLDSPGEWHFDGPSQTLYVWPGSGALPGDGFAYSSLGLGIDVNRKQNIVIEGIAIRNARDAVYAQRSQNVALRHLDITNIVRYGIDGEGMVGFELSDSRISNTGSDVLYGPASTGSVVRDNDITNSGVVLDGNGKVANLPLPSFGAIRTGPSALISGNRLRGLASIGIAAGSGSQVTDNAITDYCYLVNDCSGIYFPGADGALVTGNLVTGAVGNRLGIPSRFNASLANGLYLDLWTTNVHASGNTFAGGDYGIQLHDGYENRLERNLVYGGRGNLLWLQETKNDKRAAGNIYGNVVSDNAFFPTNLLPTLRNSAYVENTTDFASYQGNVYSNLMSTVMATESSPTGGRSFQLPDWQTATDANGAPRNLDYGARVGAPLDGFASGLLGTTLVANGNLSGGTTGWTAYNATPPWAAIVLDSCAPLTPQCLRMTAGGSNSHVASPRFSVSKGQWYRVSFDAQVDTAGATFRVKAIQAGPSYDGIMNTDQLILAGSTTLKRYSFVFQSLTTAQVSATSTGARVDFMDTKPGHWIRLANFEVVPLTLNPGVIRHALLSNPSRSTINATCPTADTAPAECANYYLFPQGSRAVWPVTLAPLAAQVVFSQNAVLPDDDRDGVADSQDLCPATASGVATNARGCGLGQ